MVRLIGLTVAFFASFICITDCEGAEILGVLPYPGKSHNLVTLPLFVELAKRGHRVTVVGYHEPKNPPANYSTILLDLTQGSVEFVTIDFVIGQTKSYVEWNMNLLLAFAENFSGTVKNSKLLALQNNKYDLIITEYFNMDSYLGFIHNLKAPFIFIHTAEAFPWHRTAMGDPLETSHQRHIFTEWHRNLDFLGRLLNFLETYWMIYYHSTALNNVAESAASGTYTGPSLARIAKNASLYLVNTHFSFHGSRSMNPSTIQIGGINVAPVNPLPQDIKKLMDQSKNGVIFFSLGSVVKANSLDQKKRDIFVKVFSSLIQTVLWKWEGTLPNKPSNVHVAPWLPQRDIFVEPGAGNSICRGGSSSIRGPPLRSSSSPPLHLFQPSCKLSWTAEEIRFGFGSNPVVISGDLLRNKAHPNMKLYIGHCGLLGMNEAITEAVPTICFPLFGDQEFNSKCLTLTGMGMRLSIKDLTEKDLRHAIMNLIEDPKYKENAVKVSKAFLDRPMSPLDTAVYWSEYVIRHKGAPQLRSPARDMNWIEYHNVDVVATIAAAILLVIYLFYKMVGSCTIRLLPRKKEKSS